VLFDPILAILV